MPARPSAVRDRNPVDAGLGHARGRANGALDLGGGHVLTFPAERVADPVHKGDVAQALGTHQVPAVDPHIALFEHVVQQLGLGRLGIGIAIEGMAGVDFR
jgi:hypothetical protein